MTTADNDGAEPEPYAHMSRAQLIRCIQSLTIESARHRRGKRSWKTYAQRLEREIGHDVE
ncbi:hypothetical protein [Bifidobacterium aerophilum]|uniref:Uncharacterized protein n=1 Tax=Bifidobacterium aerophilum TaxID=1798155 RepID=A0A6N9Z331_9BIFI|nr:hypothetical protein [Bifidobacterium aerophilum]NEG88605.1 hypothetical protein [Bifidobacterium aerophilum]